MEALGLNIRQPPAAFALIPTYQPQHHLLLVLFIDLDNLSFFGVDTDAILASSILWHFDFSCLDKNLEPHLRAGWTKRIVSKYVVRL